MEEASPRPTTSAATEPSASTTTGKFARPRRARSVSRAPAPSLSSSARSMIARSGRRSDPRLSTDGTSARRSRTRASSPRTSSIAATSVSLPLTTSTRPPAISRCWSAEAAATSRVAPLPRTSSSSPSRAASTSSPDPCAVARARACDSMRSMAGSSCCGS